MQVVWEVDTSDFAKRKRAARACAACQRRKKRCHHTFSRDLTADNADEVFDRTLSNLKHKQPVKFMGCMSPESILTDLSSRAKGAPRHSNLGCWVATSPEVETYDDEEANGTVNTVNTKTTPAVERYRQVERGRRALTGHQKNYLHAIGALRVLPKATQDALVTTYIACIDTLLPILDGGRVLREYAAGTVSPFLIQAICLVASKTEEAGPFLQLTEDGPLMDPIPFARALHTGLDAAMKADLEADRLTKVQILTLMSFHNDGPGGIEESSVHLVQAIHDAYTAGLHILMHGRKPNDEASYTWWSIWILDKLNACLGGRAIMIADRDIGLPRPPKEHDPHHRSHTLAMWLALADTLADVIGFYRPTAIQNSTGWEEDFPSFQELCARKAEISFQQDIPQTSHRSLLELCYNVIAILTCRSGGPSTASYHRRVLAADRIQQIMTRSSTTTQDPTDAAANLEPTTSSIPPLPVVPYAVSLSMTVAYRLFRDSSSSGGGTTTTTSLLPGVDKTKVKSDLAVRCSILESLSKRWWSADAMAKLGQKALRSLKSESLTAHNNTSTTSTAGLTGNPATSYQVNQAMDAEVSVCKYAPFTRGVSDTPTRHQEKKKSRDPKPKQSGTALDMLSNAAAMQGGRRQQQQDHSLDYSVGVDSSFSDDNFGRDLNGTTALSSLDHEGFGTANPATAIMSNDAPPADFQELDALFGDFFDVGMPTFFVDPLFGGDAFGSFADFDTTHGFI